MTQPQRPRAGAKKAPAKKAVAKKAPAKKAAAKRAAPVEAPTIDLVPPSELHSPAYETGLTAGRATRRWLVPVLTIVLALLGGGALINLSKAERGGPPHFNLYLGESGVPGTLYLPGEELKGDDLLPAPKPVGQRPPLIVMAHGYSADQVGMSTMARAIARAGFATLTFDFRGHGYNRNHFKGDITLDLDTVLDWAETSPYIDPSRIAVLGHSMGAGAAVDFSTKDPRVAMMIPVSGSDTLHDTYTPPSALFLIASGDPGETHDYMEREFATYKARPGVHAKYVEISGTDHVTVISDPDTFAAITSFLDDSFGTPADRLPPKADPRRAIAGRYLVVALALIALLGRLVGKGVRPLPSTTKPGAWLLLVGAMLITMPLLAVGGFSVLPVHAGQQVAVAFGFAAAILWGIRHYAHIGVIHGRVAEWVGDGPWLPLRTVGLPGALSGVALFVLLAPAALTLHTAVPDLERAFYWAILAAAMLPFFAAFEAIVRRGSWWQAILLGIAGRGLLLLTLVIGIFAGALPFVLLLVLQLLAMQYVVLELFAAFAWAKTRNTALIAVVDAVFVAWIAVMFSPIG